MCAGNTPRASIEPFQHAAVDTELKNLKLFGRRLQSALTIHATELQILQRLYYKNKNQHRGALFWRNVIEIRRFLERIERLNLLDSINALRSKFYDTSQNVNSIKGPWTHCPDEKHLSNFSEQCRKGSKLVEMAADRCLDAYRSFHRSLQSAAFLQILLVFVAISSRTRTLAVELHEILQLISSCANRLTSITISSADAKIQGSLDSVSPPSADGLDVDAVGLPFTSSTSNVIYNQQGASQTNAASPPNQFQAMLPYSGIIIERTVPSKVPKKTRKKSQEAKEGFASVGSSKKKRKVPRNEIDDIFGF